MCSLMMIDRSKHVGDFKCFNVCFRIIKYILVHLLVLIISEWAKLYQNIFPLILLFLFLFIQLQSVNFKC
jgi:hypothetical protein